MLAKSTDIFDFNKDGDRTEEEQMRFVQNLSASQILKQVEIQLHHMDSFMNGLSANRAMMERFTQSKLTLQKQRLSKKMDQRMQKAQPTRVTDRASPLPGLIRAKSVVSNRFVPKRATSACIAMHQTIRARKVQES